MLKSIIPITLALLVSISYSGCSSDGQTGSTKTNRQKVVKVQGEAFLRPKGVNKEVVFQKGMEIRVISEATLIKHHSSDFIKSKLRGAILDLEASRSQDESLRLMSLGEFFVYSFFLTEDPVLISSTDSTGKFEFFVPQGKYFLLASTEGVLDDRQHSWIIPFEAKDETINLVLSEGVRFGGWRHEVCRLSKALCDLGE
jgi:hypothetical protein